MGVNSMRHPDARMAAASHSSALQWTQEPRCAYATKQPAGHHHVARTQPSSPQATTVLRARHQAARRPSTCCAHATKQPAGHHRVARTQPSSPQAANVLRARNPKQPAGRQRVASTHATLSSPQAANVLQAGTLLQLILFALKYILECMDLIYRQKIHIIEISYTAYMIIPSHSRNLACSRAGAPQGYRRARSLEPKL